MSEKIEPALSAKEWAELAEPPYAPGTMARLGYIAGEFWPKRPLAVFAAFNDALPDDDPRKITRARLDAIRYYAARDEDTIAFADALESYLPPETK